MLELKLYNQCGYSVLANSHMLWAQVLTCHFLPPPRYFFTRPNDILSDTSGVLSIYILIAYLGVLIAFLFYDIMGACYIGNIVLIRTNNYIVEYSSIIGKTFIS